METTMGETDEPWGALCTRGALTMEVMTRGQALAVGKMVHPLCQYVGITRPDDGPASEIGFTSMSTLREFIVAMQPRAVTIQCTRAENKLVLQAALGRKDTDPLH